MTKKKLLDCVYISGKAPNYFAGTKTYVSTGALETDHIDFDKTEVITYDSRPSRADVQCDKGDVIFAKMYATNKTLLITDEETEYIYSTGFCCLTPKQDIVSSETLYYLLNSPSFISQKDKFSSGSTQKAITNLGLNKIVVGIPELEEQKNLNDTLGKLHLFIDNCEKLLDKYDLLIKSQFIEMFGNKQETILLNKISTIIMGQSPNGSTYNKSSMGLPFYQGKTDFGETYINSPSTWTTRPTKIAESDDILLSVRAPVGSTNICNLKCCIGRGLAAIKPNKNLATSYYLLYSLRYIQNEIEDLGTGSTFKCISKNQVSTLKVPCSDYATQLVFSNFVNQIDKSKFRVKQLQEKAETLYKALLQKYFG